MLIVVPPFEELFDTYKPYLKAAAECGDLTVEDLLDGRKIANNCDWRKIVVHTLRMQNKKEPISYGHLRTLMKKVKHSAVIYMVKIANNYLDEKYGDQKFIDKYIKYHQTLKANNLLYNKDYI